MQRERKDAERERDEWRKRSRHYLEAAGFWLSVGDLEERRSR